MANARNPAVKAAQNLAETAKELRLMLHGDKELHEIDAKHCDDAAALLRVLDTEVFRHRQAILTYCDGRMERSDLRSIARTWDDGSPS